MCDPNRALRPLRHYVTAPFCPPRWIAWLSDDEAEVTISPSARCDEIVVPTVDSMRTEGVLRLLASQHKPALLCGATATGKTQVWTVDETPRNRRGWKQWQYDHYASNDWQYLALIGALVTQFHASRREALRLRVVSLNGIGNRRLNL